jgi:hypothetical protein
VSFSFEATRAEMAKWQRDGMKRRAPRREIGGGLIHLDEDLFLVSVFCL